MRLNEIRSNWANTLCLIAEGATIVATESVALWRDLLQATAGSAHTQAHATKQSGVFPLYYRYDGAASAILQKPHFLAMAMSILLLVLRHESYACPKHCHKLHVQGNRDSLGWALTSWTTLNNRNAVTALQIWWRLACSILSESGETPNKPVARK